jgi:DNA-binding transcriptional regulator PaaX
VDVESFLLLEARPGAGETDAQIVAGAWDFAEINRCYAAHGNLLARRPVQPLDNPVAAAAFHRWLREEQQAWKSAMEQDPLLPGALLPADYVGREAWRRRLAVMAESGKQMRSFRPT